ncbi:hypothetical protein Belba_1078 [Belliella baltica DSM 15883]|uniref:Uncharacterized protein n=1 Tax=Belliella baltica (strain DSM 15883 / CIP 108006 / LMG 21964 / BA134) TaxID=866536 RepID=I3Z398_BELBD|nr:hypothetical protein [Belliella baltica]AFL83716.1 hypothetical protein Belba_1078 [Belliella baltica DSM 15883]
MSDAENINVYAYLTPHPLDDESHLEEEWIDWLPGYIKGETDEEQPSQYHDENIALYDRIEELSTKVFRAALTRMFPLLKDFHFKNIQISIDYLNYFNSTALAGYDHQASNPAKGIYVFHINQRLLNRYLHLLEGNQNAIPNMSIWEHEIIHMIDHWQLIQASAFSNSDIPTNNLLYYQLKYREEGIANLFDLLDGKLDGIKSIKEAKEKFKVNYTSAKAQLEGLSKSTDQIRSSIYAGFDFYEIGPWLIVDMLMEFLCGYEFEDPETLEQRIASGVVIPDDIKFNLFELALKIDNEWFLGKLELEES